MTLENQNATRKQGEEGKQNKNGTNPNGQAEKKKNG